MKKLILFIGCILLLHACEFPTEDVPQVQESGYLIHTTLGDWRVKIMTFTLSNGHTYEMLYDNGSGLKSMQHHPLCEACEKERKERQPESILEQEAPKSEYWGW